MFYLSDRFVSLSPFRLLLNLCNAIIFVRGAGMGPISKSMFQLIIDMIPHTIAHHSAYFFFKFLFSVRA
jgi:hypothetical protein